MTSSEQQELRGTFACPICGWPEPHAHSAGEIAERPAIDGARIAFEKHAREFMWKQLKRWGISAAPSYWWGVDAELGSPARQRKDGEVGWAARDYGTGPYSNPWVQMHWQLWRTAWLAARGVFPVHEPLGFDDDEQAGAAAIQEPEGR